MNRAAAIVGSVLFLVVAPGTLVVLIPFWISGWRLAPPLLGFVGFRVLGALLMAVGLPVLLDSFARFALQGLGTPAPITPPERLVVTGLYRHLRNPIYVALPLLIVGQALFAIADRDVIHLEHVAKGLPGCVASRLDDQKIRPQLAVLR